MKSARTRKRPAEESSRLKDELLGVMTHELRSSLNAVLGWTHLLRRGGLDAATSARGLEAIQSNVELQSRILASAVDAFAMIGGELPAALKRVDLAKAAMGAVVAGKPAADAKGVLLHERLASGAAFLQGDGDRLQRALGRLVANAIRFTPSGGSVEISLSRAGARLEVVVKDSGAGIAPAALARLARRFKAPATASKHLERGLGLGLAIVSRVAQLHGGSLRASSAGEGHGATFTLTLPAAS